MEQAARTPESDEIAENDAAAADRAPPQVAAPAYQAAETRRLYAADWAGFAAWGSSRQLGVLPAAPDTVARYLRTLSATLSPGALARRAAAIADRHRRENLPSPAQHECVRRVLQAAREAKRATMVTASAVRRPAPPGPAQLRRMAARCSGDLAGLRDRALLLFTAAGLGGERLLALDREHVQFTAQGVVLAIPAIGAQACMALEPLPGAALGAAGQGGPVDEAATAEAAATAAPFLTGRLAAAAECPVRALERWLEHSETRFGPVFRKVNRWGGVEHGRLRPDALRRIWRRRAAALRPPPAPSRDRAEDAA